MILDATKYIWSKWQQPVFTGNDTWGTVTASSCHGTEFEPYKALDADDNTHFEGEDYTDQVIFTWIFDKPLKIYRLEFVNKPTGSTYLTTGIEAYADDEMNELIASGTFEVKSKSKLYLELDQPIASDKLVLKLTGNRYVGLTSILLIAESGIEKTVLTPFLNAIDDMEVISGSYNDDGTFSTTGLAGFMFNNLAAATMYISSNHWLGFGTQSEQLTICRRDGCSTAIYRQIAETTNGLQFLKIRFEGYTIYNNRVESNRLIFELFLLSNNDMFLNVIQTPTSGNVGTSTLICNGHSTSLTLVDGTGGGTQVSFYHQDTQGLEWNVVYDTYEENDTYSFAYLIRQEDTFFSYENEQLIEVPIKSLSASMFLKYGFEELPPANVLTPISNPQMYLWKAGGPEQLLKASVKAYPYPQTLTAIADMSHISILGIKMITAECSGNVTVSISVDSCRTFSEEVSLTEWLNVDPEELYNSLDENKQLILHFILHDDATLSRFKITYIN